MLSAKKWFIFIYIWLPVGWWSRVEKTDMDTWPHSIQVKGMPSSSLSLHLLESSYHKKDQFFLKMVIIIFPLQKGSQEITVGPHGKRTFHTDWKVSLVTAHIKQLHFHGSVKWHHSFDKLLRNPVESINKNKLIIIKHYSFNLTFVVIALTLRSHCGRLGSGLGGSPLIFDNFSYSPWVLRHVIKLLHHSYKKHDYNFGPLKR